MLTRKEAEDYIYKSYMNAEKYMNFNDKDALKRHPEYSAPILHELSKAPVLTVTGSKGKGSVACMISEILQTAYNVGLMTSPHISDFCERFRFNGKQISDKEFISYVEKVKSEFAKAEEALAPKEYISPIALQAAVALCCFNDKHTDFNVMEHGKGAKYDDVTNIKHQYAVINGIFSEHIRELGNSVAEIAKDKVCTITDDVRVAVSAEQIPEVSAIIRQRAYEKNCTLLEYGKDFAAENIKFSKSGMLFDVATSQRSYKDIRVPLLGIHQAKNCALAMAVCERILPQIDLSEIKKRLTMLNWPGRQEIISSEPFIMLDACINRASAQSVKITLEQLNVSRATVIIGIPDDKDFCGVAESMQSVADSIILTKSSNPHYIFTKKQSEYLQNKGIYSAYTDCVEEAISEARKSNLPIIILGTTSLVSDVKKFFSSQCF